MTQAGKRLQRAIQLADRIEVMRQELQRVGTALRLTVQSMGALDVEIKTEVAAAREAVLDEQAHHMDPHPTPATVLGGSR